MWKSSQKHDHHFYGEITIFSDKSTFLLNKLLISWFHRNFLAWSRFSTFPHYLLMDFYVTQILREINYGECRSCKTAIFAILRDLNFVHLANFRLLKMQKFIKIRIKSLYMENGRFCTSTFATFDFTKNLRDWKIQKFPHSQNQFSPKIF